MAIRLASILGSAPILWLWPLVAWGSVVMTGTRVIYPGDAREQTVQLTNEDDHPNLVQMWVDRGHAHGTAAAADADGPFIPMPGIFRMEPHAGQMVRLVFSGEALAQDRESVFLLNFSQVPAIEARHLHANKLVLVFSNRIKIFYRPGGLPGSPADLPGAMRFTRHAGGAARQVMVENPTAYHAVIHSAWVGEGEGQCVLASAVMVPPLAQASWDVPAGCRAYASAARLKMMLVNDFGAAIASEAPLQ